MCVCLHAEAVVGAGGYQLKQIFSGLRGRASGSNNFYEYTAAPVSPHSAPHPRLGPGPVCLRYVAHVARLCQLRRATYEMGL